MRINRYLKIILYSKNRNCFKGELPSIEQKIEDICKAVRKEKALNRKQSLINMKCFGQNQRKTSIQKCIAKVYIHVLKEIAIAPTIR